MGLLRNVAGQAILVYARNVTNDTGITGDVANISMFVSIDNGVFSALGTALFELSAANAPGFYRQPLTQTQTDGRTLLFAGNSSTANIEISGVEIHTDQWLFDGINWDVIVDSMMAVLFGEATRTGTGTDFLNRDGATVQTRVTHDTIGNRTASGLDP